jgi:hypothetical protein
MVLHCRLLGWGRKTGKVCEFVGNGGCGGKVTVAGCKVAVAAATAMVARSSGGGGGGKVTVAAAAAVVARSQWQRRRLS